MIKTQPTTIVLTTAVAMMTALTLLSNTILDGHSQGLEIPEFKPKPSENIAVPDFQLNDESSVKKPSEEIAMKVQLKEHENEFMDDWYQVSNFAFIASNTSKLCTSGNCEYELDNGEMAQAFIPGERMLTGKFKIDTGVSKKLMDLSSSWEAVEELERNGETIQVVEGTLGVGKDAFTPEHEYKINGTLSTDGDGYLLEVKGMK
jgi:hypothetical protein